MAFRKRNVVIGQTQATSEVSTKNVLPRIRGTRPSPLTSQIVTSTGTASLDDLLGGHCGLALGSSILIEESGTTDYAGTLLRFFAAEGISQGHVLHVVGVEEGWVRDLPGMIEGKSAPDHSKSPSIPDEKMRIAWRYQNLNPLGAREQATSQAAGDKTDSPFIHSFDLTKRLTIPPDARINYLSAGSRARPFTTIIEQLSATLRNSASDTVHRVVVPAILSPAYWPSTSNQPGNFLAFLHSVRVLTRQHPDKLVAMMTIPLELYPRLTGLVRWAEIISDGVLELTPFPHLSDDSNSLAESGGARSNEEQPQGMLHVHKLPVISERGEGGAGVGNSIGGDFAFTVSRKRFTITPFALPPLEGDQEAQKDAGKMTAKDIEF